MLTLGSAEHKARVDSERNQGRRPTWAGSTTTGSASTTG
jgi:hypothetical protein